MMTAGASKKPALILTLYSGFSESKTCKIFVKMYPFLFWFNTIEGKFCSGQSYRGSTIVNYDSRVVLDL